MSDAGGIFSNECLQQFILLLVIGFDAWKISVHQFYEECGDLHGVHLPVELLRELLRIELRKIRQNDSKEDLVKQACKDVLPDFDVLQMRFYEFMLRLHGDAHSNMKVASAGNEHCRDFVCRVRMRDTLHREGVKDTFPDFLYSIYHRIIESGDWKILVDPLALSGAGRGDRRMYKMNKLVQHCRLFLLAEVQVILAEQVDPWDSASLQNAQEGGEGVPRTGNGNTGTVNEEGTTYRTVFRRPKSHYKRLQRGTPPPEPPSGPAAGTAAGKTDTPTETPRRKRRKIRRRERRRERAAADHKCGGRDPKRVREISPPRSVPRIP